MGTAWIVFACVLAVSVLLVGYIVGHRRHAVVRPATMRDEQGDLATAPSAGLASEPPEVVRLAEVAAPKPTEIIVGAVDAPLITVKMPDALATGRREPLTLPPGSRRALAPLLQHAPRVLVEGASAISSATKLVMVFSPEATKALGRGVLELTPSGNLDGAVRAVARTTDGSKKFVENANILAEVNIAAVAAAAWQVAAIVTAQKFLADINAKLATIERGVAAIMRSRQDEVASKLEANLAYLRDRADTIRAGTVNVMEMQAIVGQLEEIDRTTRAITRQMTRQLHGHTQDVANASWGSSWFNAESTRCEAEEAVAQGEDTARKVLFSTQVRLLTASLRSALGLHDEYNSRSVDSLRGELASLQEAWSGFDGAVDVRLHDIGAPFQFGETDRKQRGSVRGALVDATQRVREERAATTKSVGQLQKLIQSGVREADLPLHLEVEVDGDGNILHADRLLLAPRDP